MSKDFVERYSLRSENGEDYFWATFMLSENGMLSIQSDYGDYSHFWFAFGSDFKAFLVKCGDDYLMSKFCDGRRELDYHATMIDIKRDLIKQRKLKEIHSVDARHLYDRLCSFHKNEYITDSDLLLKKLIDMEIVFFLYGDEPYYVPVTFDYTAQLKNFMKFCWKPFKQVLKNEINLRN